MKKILIPVFLAGIFCPSLIKANMDPPLPDISKWIFVNSSPISLRITDRAVVYLGIEKEYKNPNDTNEYIKVVGRHISLPILEKKTYDQESLRESGSALIIQKEEKDLLDKYSQETDPFIYLKWRIVKDSRTGLNILDPNSDVEIWFMPAEGPKFDGSLYFFKNEKIAVEFLTENIRNQESRNIFSGIESRIGDKYHIMRAGRNNIIELLGGVGQ